MTWLLHTHAYTHTYAYTYTYPYTLQASDAAAKSDRMAAAALRSEVESLTQQLDAARRLHHTASVTVQDQDEAFKVRLWAC